MRILEVPHAFTNPGILGTEGTRPNRTTSHPKVGRNAWGCSSEGHQMQKTELTISEEASQNSRWQERPKGTQTGRMFTRWWISAYTKGSREVQQNT